MSVGGDESTRVSETIEILNTKHKPSSSQIGFGPKFEDLSN